MGKQWKFEDCEEACAQHDGCVAVDIQAYSYDDFGYNLNTCVLYDIHNVQSFKYCTEAKGWLTCTNTGKRNSHVDELTKAGEFNELKKAGEFSDEFNKAGESDSPAEAKTVPAAESHSSSDLPISEVDVPAEVGRAGPHSLPGWNCKGSLRCLHGKPLKTYKFGPDEKKPWHFETCQDACAQHDQCVAVDIQWYYYGDFGYYVSTCVLYDIENVQSFKYCTKAKGWETCTHTGKRNSHPIIV